MNASDQLVQLLPHLKVVRGPDKRGEYVAWCPLHADGQGKPPHSPNLRVSERGWFCDVCNRGGSLRELAKEVGIAIESKTGLNIVAEYDYNDERGNLLFQVVRLDPKGFRQRCRDAKGKWSYSLNGTRRVPYRLPDLLADPTQPVWIVEGEKDVDRLRALGLIATTNPMGAGKWRSEYSKFLRNRDVVIVPDNDQPGEDHAQSVAISLQGKAHSIKVVRLPGLPEKGDVSDWLDAGHSLSELAQFVASTPEFNSGNGTPPSAARSGEGGKRSQADEMLALGKAAGLTHLRDDLGEPFLQISIDGHQEVWPAGSRSARSWLTRLYHQAHDRAPNLTAIGTAVNALQSQARLEGHPVRLMNRVSAQDGNIYCDLADHAWRQVRITADSWEVLATPPPLFRRYMHQQPQVLPASDGSIEDLFELINFADPNGKLLLMVYLVTALIPDIPHPVCIVYGPQGSSKTTMSKMLSQLIDPSQAPVQSLPEKPDVLIQALAHNWMPIFDNVSGLPRWASDIFCRSATGEGFTKRALYTDDEDFIWTFRRCPILNGINVAAIQPDLLDRAILLGLERIDPKDRRSEEELWADFESLRPRLLGAMFTTLSQAMREKPKIYPSALPRMADFAHWGMAVAAALGYQPGEFLTAYDENIRRQNNEVISAHPLAAALVEFAENHPTWGGSATELLGLLDQIAGKLHLRTDDRAWPRQPNQLTRKLNELAATLQDAGVAVRVTRGRKGSLIEVTRTRREGDDA